MNGPAVSTRTAAARAWPWGTIGFGVLALAAVWWPDGERWGVFDRARVSAGEVWRLWTAHAVHFGAAHLGWNLAVLVPVLAWAECRAPGRARAFLALGPGAISAGLWALEPDLQRYAGASGLAVGAVTLLALVQRGEARQRTERWFWTAVLALVAAKVAVEWRWPGTGWVQYDRPEVRTVPLAHAFGVLAAVAVHAVAGRLHPGARRLGGS